MNEKSATVGQSKANGPTNPGKVSQLPHLPHLDGLRGLAAMYVVLFHLQLLLTVYVGIPVMPHWLIHALELIRNGHTAVCVFIVLSGYVITLPLVFSHDNRLRGGISNFIKRRARRILPPYYAALLLFSTFIFAVQLRHINPDIAKQMRPIDFAEHVFLVHNFDPLGWNQIDGAMWSLATEWQIYLVFAFLLVPVWRRIGMGGTLAVATCLALAPHYLLPQHYNGDTANPWFLILFAFGMLSAQWSYRQPNQRVRWLWVSAVFAGIWLITTYRFPVPVFPDSRLLREAESAWVPDIMSGAATAAFLLHCKALLQKEATENTPRSLLMNVLCSRTATGLGMFSYSLYLIHQPLIDCLVQYLRLKHWHLSAEIIWCVAPLFLPIILIASYLFYLLFERPFTKNTKKAAVKHAQ